MIDQKYRQSISSDRASCIRWKAYQLGFISAVILIAIVVEPAKAEYTWIEQCDKEIGVSVPAFSCMDGVVAPKEMIADGPKGEKRCKRPEILNNRCVYNSRVGRLKGEVVTEGTKVEDVDIIFSCRKNMGRDASGKLDLHTNDTAGKFWDVAVIQYNRKNGKTCFYQHLGKNDKEDALEVPKSNSDDGRDFWNFDNLVICTSCHTNGPFVRSPHYWDLVNDSSNNHILPEEDDLPYKIVHEHFPVANVDFDGNSCTNCHNVGAYFLKHQWRIGKINQVATGTISSLQDISTAQERSPQVSTNTDIYEPDNPSPTETGYHDFMSDKTSKLMEGLEELTKCLEIQKTRDIKPYDKSDNSPFKKCSLTLVSP